MRRLIIVVALAVIVGIWWVAVAPRAEIQVAGGPLAIDAAAEEAIRRVDRSSEFAANLQQFPSSAPAFDDAVFLPDGATALLTAIDGQIWRMNIANHSAAPLVDPPLMAYGIHDAPGDPNHFYFCSSRSYSEAAPDERVGLYRLTLDTRKVEALVLDVPATDLMNEVPIVYADNDPSAPEHRPRTDSPKRPLIVCDNLEVSEDGRRIYFSEPFDYTGASVDDALDEAIALSPNGRLWRYDLETGATRLIAEGFHFINGVLYDLHPGQPREESVVVTQTSLFRLTRFYLSGPMAGRHEVVLDGITGLDDGIDRDEAGRIWLALFADRTRLLTWVHQNPWIKPLFMRVPARLLTALPQRTGVVVVSPDGRTPLYSAIYDGTELASIASAVPSRGGIYLANEALGAERREQTRVARLKWPPALQ